MKPKKMPSINKNDKRRFFEKFELGLPGECWEWRARTLANGYGHFGINGSNFLAHRISFLISKFSPDNLYVLHKCDNRSCVNPAHLFLGSKRDNTKDMIKKGRRVYVGKRGDSSHFSKLTAKEVKEIRSLREDGLTYVNIAKMFNITYGNVGHIINGRTWRE